MSGRRGRAAPVQALLVAAAAGADAQGRQTGRADGPPARGIPGPPPSLVSGCPGEELAPEPPGNDDSVTVQRTECFGSCPGYTVVLHASGAVGWHGQGHVARQGDAGEQVPAEAARRLIDEFQAAGFWKLCASYNRTVTDVPTTTTTLRIGGRQKSVSDRAEGAPEWLRRLDEELDSLADTHQWIHGDPAAEVFQGFLYADRRGPKPGFTPLMRASAAGDAAEIQQQLAAGADANARDASGWTPLMYATVAMHADAMRILLAAGADPNLRSAMGQTALMAASEAYYATEEKLQLLLAAGARQEIRDARNMSALDYFDNLVRAMPSARAAELQRMRLLLQ